jgi:hypothetical protein
VEQRKPHTHSELFAEQFMWLLGEHWSEIVLFIHRQSPRLASILHNASPGALLRVDGTWHIHIQTGWSDRLRRPRDNEIVAQAIRLWAHSAARLKLPFVIVDFDQPRQI